jgi:hypothetical protein
MSVLNVYHPSNENWNNSMPVSHGESVVWSSPQYIQICSPHFVDLGYTLKEYFFVSLLLKEFSLFSCIVYTAM